MHKIHRFTSLFLLLCFSIFVVGCSGGRSTNQSQLPPIDDSRGTAQRQSAPQQQRQPMLTKKNMVILAGAAAMYYMYKKRQNATAKHGPDSQYYLSKNGRVYYRDEQGRAHWVTPPQEGIMVPAAEASQYQEFQGYNGQAHGRDLTSVGAGY
jgi:hypothetical protein